jgi:uncharacterized protein
MLGWGSQKYGYSPGSSKVKYYISILRGKLDRILQCPNCSAEMQLMQKYEVDIDYCPRCKGVWLNRGEIDKIANIQNRYEDAHYQKYHYGQSDYDDYDTGYYSGRRRNRGFFGDLFYF